MSKNSNQVPDETMSTVEAATFADVDVKTIRHWFDSGLIGGESVPFGSRILRRVLRLSLEKYLASRKSE